MGWGDEPQHDEPRHAPGEPLGDDAPSVAELQYQQCPNCTTGVLFVTRYDPKALHEAGQPLGEVHQLRSGGAYERKCFNCTYTDSVSLNPEEPQ